MIACLVLFIAGGFRAFNLYKTYKSYNREIELIEKNTDENMHTILRAILKEGHDMINNNTKNDSVTLHRIMIESMSMNEIYDNIVSKIMEFLKDDENTSLKDDWQSIKRFLVFIKDDINYLDI